MDLCRFEVCRRQPLSYTPLLGRSRRGAFFGLVFLVGWKRGVGLLRLEAGRVLSRAPLCYAALKTLLRAGRLSKWDKTTQCFPV